VWVDILVYDGLDELDAVGPLEVLRSAAAAGAGLDVRLVSGEAPREVVGAYGLRFLPDAPWQPGAEVLVVPGGGWADRAERGAWGEVRRGELFPLLRQAAADGAVMAAVCSGAMLVAAAGLVGTRRAATHHSAAADLAATGAQVVDDRVVDEGDLVTSGGVTAGIDLALWLVERFFDRELADRLARRMEYRRWRPGGG